MAALGLPPGSCVLSNATQRNHSSKMDIFHREIICIYLVVIIIIVKCGDVRWFDVFCAFLSSCEMLAVSVTVANPFIISFWAREKHAEFIGAAAVAVAVSDHHLCENVSSICHQSLIISARWMLSKCRTPVNASRHTFGGGCGDPPEREQKLYTKNTYKEMCSGTARHGTARVLRANVYLVYFAKNCAGSKRPPIIEPTFHRRRQ